MSENRVRANKKNEEIANLKLKIEDLEANEFHYQMKIKEALNNTIEKEERMVSLLYAIEIYKCTLNNLGSIINQILSKPKL